MNTKAKKEMYTAIENHGRALLAAFPNASEKNPVTLAKMLRRLEVKAAAVSLSYCNGEGRYAEHEVAEKEAERLVNAANRILQAKAPFIVHFNPDPRGYALKLDDKETEAYNRQDHVLCTAGRIHQDWGGYGIVAPNFNPEK